MRSAGILGIGIATLFALPAAAAFAANSVGHQYVDANSGPPTQIATERPEPSGSPKPSPQVAGNMAVTIPDVVFTGSIQLQNGQVVTPVLVTAGQPSGIVSLVGSGMGERCMTTATPGTAAWLNCSVPASAGGLRVVVTLADGRVFSAPVAGSKPGSTTDR